MERVFEATGTLKSKGIAFISLGVLIFLGVVFFLVSGRDDYLYLAGAAVLAFFLIAEGLRNKTKKVIVTDDKVIHKNLFSEESIPINDIKEMNHMYTRFRGLSTRGTRGANHEISQLEFFSNSYNSVTLTINNARHIKGFEELLSLLEQLTGKKIEKSDTSLKRKHFMKNISSQ